MARSKKTKIRLNQAQVENSKVGCSKSLLEHAEQSRRARCRRSIFAPEDDKNGETTGNARRMRDRPDRNG